MFRRARHVLLTLILFTLAWVPLSGLPAPKWPIERVQQSIAKLTYTEKGGNCTAVAIGKNNVFITASHCEPTVGGMIIDEWLTVRKLMREAGDLGVMVLKGEADKKFRPLELAEPRIGTDILAIGFGDGAPVPLLFEGVYTHPDLLLPDGTATLSFFSSHGTYGMSGGPVIDRDGHLVSIVIGSFEGGLQHITTGVKFADLAKIVQAWKGK